MPAGFSEGNSFSCSESNRPPLNHHAQRSSLVPETP
jgi:hypothetical protein